MTRADDIKSSIDLRSYIEQQTGVTFNRAGKCNCPLPGHDDTRASFALNKSGDSWKCYGACGTGGSVIDFVMRYNSVNFKQALDMLVPQSASSNGNKPKSNMQKMHTAYPGMKDYATKQYDEFAYDVFIKAGFREKRIGNKLYMAMPTRDKIDRLRNLSGSGTKCLPDFTNEIVKELKNRREQKEVNGEELLPEDYVQAQWFGLEEAIELAKRPNEFIGKKLVLCNGQTSTVIAQHFGIPAFCKTDGENLLPSWLLPELIALLQDGWQLYIALDCDNDGKGHKVATQIIMQLFQFSPVFIDLQGSDGYDLADHCIKHQNKSWEILQTMIAPLPKSAISDMATVIENAIKELAKKQYTGPRHELPVLLDTLESQLKAVRRSIEVPGIEIISTSEVYEDFEEALKNPQWITGLRTGIEALDNRLGGLEVGICTFMGETGTGKTTLAMSLAPAFLRQSPGLIVCGEASRKQIINRLVGCIAGVPWKSLSKGIKRIQNTNKAFSLVKFTSEELTRIRNAYREVMVWEKQGILNFYHDSNDNNKRPLNTVSLKVRIDELCEKKPIEWAILDSVDNIPTPGANKEYEQISQAMFAFEEITRDYEIPVVTTSQGGRNTKGRSNKVLGIHDALGSNHVEGKSFYLLSIYNHWVMVKNGEVNQNGNDESLYPLDTARIYIKKLRDEIVGGWVTAKFIGGTGWYNYDE